MRTFLFGGISALIVTFIVGGKDKTINHFNYFSTYKVQALAFLGAAIIWCLYPLYGMIDIFTR